MTTAHVTELLFDVLVPKYSHSGSGYTRVYASGLSQDDADRTATALRKGGLYRFVEVVPGTPASR